MKNAFERAYQICAPLPALQILTATSPGVFACVRAHTWLTQSIRRPAPSRAHKRRHPTARDPVKALERVQLIDSEQEINLKEGTGKGKRKIANAGLKIQRCCRQ